MTTFLITVGIGALVYVLGAGISKILTQGRTSWRWPLTGILKVYDWLVDQEVSR